MDFLHALVLSLLQGLTEFIPISSSAHLILAPILLDWPDQGLAFDVAVHMGTLVAVLVYFSNELRRMCMAGLASLCGRRSEDANLAWAVVLATLPVMVAGLLSKPLIETYLRNPLIIGVSSIFFGLLLWYADITARLQRSEAKLGWRDAMVIGLAQAVALIPGTSRSGITMTAGLMLGLTREAAARFSFLLSIPTLMASGLLVGFELLSSEQMVNWGVMAFGAVVAGVSGYACIHYFICLLSRTGMLPYVVYRVLLGGVILWVFW